MLASVILNRSSKILLDETNVLWGAAELLDYLNAGLSFLTGIKPDSYVLTQSFTLTNAQAKQTLPTGGVFLFGIHRNVSPATGVITQVERNHLNHILQSWYSTAGTPAHFVYDKRDPKTFYVYPQPASGNNVVEISYSAIPARLTAAGDTLLVDDFYESPLTYYVIAHAYAKNAKRGDLGKAQAYFQLFTNTLNLKNQVQFPFSPDTPEERSQSTKSPQIGGPQE